MKIFVFFYPLYLVEREPELTALVRSPPVEVVIAANPAQKEANLGNMTKK